MKSRFTILLIIATSLASFGQKKFTAEQQKAIEELASKRKEFKAAKNDSLYLAENSDQSYYVTTITRGDQAEDLEEQIFNTKLKEVAGPFDGGNTFYLLKILSMDSLKRTKAKLVSFYPKGECTTDTAKFSKLVEKYIEAIKKGKEYSKMLYKDEASIGVRNKGITSFWEGHKNNANYDIVYERKVSDPYITKVGQEVEVLYIVEEKRNAPFRTKVVTLVKKVK
ncbi:MAG TPA: hypothetical protein VK766_11045 [Cytophagaceae bacterium]|jgi:hypothetical protein|nr:hypothetical protein [Cytophagaceae bacterium]